jgi:hypothetical protein
MKAPVTCPIYARSSILISYLIPHIRRYAGFQFHKGGRKNFILVG